MHTNADNYICPGNKKTCRNRKARVWVQRENVWQTESLWFYSLSLRQLFKKPKAVKGSRLLQWRYNGWWLIKMTALNCIMSVRWWDHDHGKESRQRLIFYSGSLSLQVISTTVAAKSLHSYQNCLQWWRHRRKRDRQAETDACVYMDIQYVMADYHSYWYTSWLRLTLWLSSTVCMCKTKSCFFVVFVVVQCYSAFWNLKKTKI